MERDRGLDLNHLAPNTSRDYSCDRGCVGPTSD